MWDDIVVHDFWAPRYMEYLMNRIQQNSNRPAFDSFNNTRVRNWLKKLEELMKKENLI